jgi:hypothetical protein
MAPTFSRVIEKKPTFNGNFLLYIFGMNIFATENNWFFNESDSFHSRVMIYTIYSSERFSRLETLDL